jgi:hypothetical protein
MVKGLKTFYLDVEIIQELKKIKNPSTLVNSYLRNYFSLPQNLKEEELKQKSDEAKQQAAMIEAELDDLLKTKAERKVID